LQEILVVEGMLALSANEHANTPMNLVMQEALHSCTHASHSLKACYASTHLKMAISWPLQVSNMAS